MVVTVCCNSLLVMVQEIMILSNKILQYDRQRINGELTPLKGLAKRRKAEASMFAGKEVKPQAAPLQFAEASKEKQVQPKQAQPKQEAKAFTCSLSQS